MSLFCRQAGCLIEPRAKSGLTPGGAVNKVIASRETEAISAEDQPAEGHLDELPPPLAAGVLLEMVKSRELPKGITVTTPTGQSTFPGTNYHLAPLIY